MTIAERVREVESRVAEAAIRAGRERSEITLVGASKTVAPERIREARDAGVRVFGENRVQEAEGKVGQVDDVEWHFIGHLQRNKARRAVELFAMIHSLDSLRLGETLDRLGRERERPVRALVEVNVGGEASKSGVAPDDALDLVERLSARAGIEILGLMTIPPPADDPADARRSFRALRDLARSIAERALPGVQMKHLSMGMSHDFEIAVEEGATLVRVGSSLFGPRPAP